MPRRRLIIALSVLLALAALLVRPSVVERWQTERLLSVPFGRGGPRGQLGLDAKSYGPADFFLARGRLYLVDPFAHRIWAVHLARGTVQAAAEVPPGAAAATLVGDRLAWVDEDTGGVFVGGREVGRVPLVPPEVLSVLDFQGAGRLAYLLVRVSGLAGQEETLYVVAGNGLRELGRGIEGIAVVPGTEVFYFLRHGRLFAPDGRSLAGGPPGTLIGADRRGRLAYLAYGPGQGARIYLEGFPTPLSLPPSDVVLGTRARLLPDGWVVWATADARGLTFFRSRLARRLTLRSRL